jgi:hypothetical protein
MSIGSDLQDPACPKACGRITLRAIIVPVTSIAGRKSNDCYQGVQHMAPSRPRTSVPNDKTLKNKAFFYLYKLVHSYGICNQLLLAVIL